mmetsp:Transcript_62155/g.140594  ORF Transcript_62155/g.140594 Transcript_62155/m.140594 type:complete len:134 (-) Transcript_62155:731-1132(-)
MDESSSSNKLSGTLSREGRLSFAFGFVGKASKLVPRGLRIVGLGGGLRKVLGGGIRSRSSYFSHMEFLDTVIDGAFRDLRACCSAQVKGGPSEDELGSNWGGGGCCGGGAVFFAPQPQSFRRPSSADWACVVC